MGAGVDSAAIRNARARPHFAGLLAVEGAGPAAMLRGKRPCRRPPPRRRPHHRCPSHGEHRLLELAAKERGERGLAFWHASCLLDTVAGAYRFPTYGPFLWKLGAFWRPFSSGAL